MVKRTHISLNREHQLLSKKRGGMKHHYSRGVISYFWQLESYSFNKLLTAGLMQYLSKPLASCQPALPPPRLSICPGKTIGLELACVQEQAAPDLGMTCSDSDRRPSVSALHFKASSCEHGRSCSLVFFLVTLCVPEMTASRS